MSTPISPLRQRMIDDMRLRNLAETTQRVYVRSVTDYNRFHGRPPDQLGYEAVREYHLHLAERGLKATSIRQILGALRFFYRTTLGRKDAAEEISMPRADYPTPSVLSTDEIAHFLAEAPSPRDRVLFATFYGAGLRVSEATTLTVAYIDSAGMTILIRKLKQ